MDQTNSSPNAITVFTEGIQDFIFGSNCLEFPTLAGVNGQNVAYKESENNNRPIIIAKSDLNKQSK